MPGLNEPIDTTVEFGQLGHPELHSEERLLLEQIRVRVNETIHEADVTGATEVRRSNGAMKNWQLTGNATFSFPADGYLEDGQPVSITMRLRQDATGGRAVSWTGVRWGGGTAPTLTTSGGREDWLMFVTLDAGTTWTGFMVEKDVR